MKGYLEAKRYLGLKEDKDMVKLHVLFERAGYNVNPKYTAWCAAFVNTCEALVGNPGTKKLNARSFISYGQYIDPKDAKEGDIVVFKRGNSAWEGHVAYFVKYIDEGKGMTILGGNQSDMVCYENHDSASLLAVRRSP